jgi:hypothetical protein
LEIFQILEIKKIIEFATKEIFFLAQNKAASNV